MILISTLLLAALVPLTIGAQPSAPAALAPGVVIQVDDAASAAAAIATARAGQVIVFAPGIYRFSGRRALWTSNAAGVTVQARKTGTVHLEFDMVEGIVVQAPRWTFENLDIRGVCATHDACEHAFHVVGKARQFVARNNTMVDFNSHIKINGAGGDFPDGGLLEANTLRNSSARATAQAVTLIDLVGASGWTMRANLIADFVKAGGDHTSYGAFAKGAGSGNRFERNVVLCEQQLRGAPGVRVGISLGGGGTGPAYCRDRACVNEQEGSAIVANLIAHCSDEGIYLNRAARSEIVHNSLIATAGMMLRYPETGARVEGNLVDGRIAVDKGARLDGGDNLDTSLARRLLGSHPLRALFADVERLDLRWTQGAPRRPGKVPATPADLCGGPRPLVPAYGAFENGACLVPGKD